MCCFAKVFITWNQGSYKWQKSITNIMFRTNNYFSKLSIDWILLFISNMMRFFFSIVYLNFNRIVDSNRSTVISIMNTLSRGRDIHIILRLMKLYWKNILISRLIVLMLKIILSCRTFFQFHERNFLFTSHPLDI